MTPHNRTATSRAAADSIDRAALQRVVLDCLASAPGGLTTDAIEERTGLRHQTASPRVIELERAGKIIRTAEKRPTRSGRGAFVYKVRPVPSFDGAQARLFSVPA